jgi:hypothetical protein
VAAVRGSGPAGVTRGLVALVALSAAAVVPAARVADPRELMKSEAVLTDADAQLLDAGGVVAKVLESPDHSEIVSFAALRVRADADRFLECMRDVHCLKANEDVLEVGRFGVTPSVRDLAGLTLDPRDRDYLSHCESGRCDVRLSDEAIERFRTGVDWSSPQSSVTAAALFRATLTELATAYLAKGNAALVQYHDNPRPVSVADSTTELLRRRLFVLDGAPELVTYLRDFPSASLTPADDFLYWYKERFWRKTAVCVNHVTVYDKGEGAARRVYVASEQLYATHYHESSLELHLFAEDATGESGTLVFLSRARADIRPGGFNWLERVIIHRLVRGRLENQFRLLRSRLEQAPPRKKDRGRAAAHAKS